jgi:hypothetical protein
MIISISGKMGSGKDTLGKEIQMVAKERYGIDFEIKKFAGKLKDISALLLNVPVEAFESQAFKSNPLPGEGVWKDNDFNVMTGRDFLVKLGTDAMREHFSKDVWVNALFADYIEGESNWIITDTRFENELDRVKQVDNHLCIYVTRGNAQPTDNNASHVSETELSAADFKGDMDLVFANGDDMEIIENFIYGDMIPTGIFQDFVGIVEGAQYLHYNPANKTVYQVINDNACMQDMNGSWIPAVIYEDPVAANTIHFVRSKEEFKLKFYPAHHGE